MPLHYDSSANLYRDRESIIFPDYPMLSASRDLILSAKTGKVEIESEISQVKFASTSLSAISNKRIP